MLSNLGIFDVCGDVFWLRGSKAGLLAGDGGNPNGERLLELLPKSLNGVENIIFFGLITALGAGVAGGAGVAFVAGGTLNRTRRAGDGVTATGSLGSTWNDDRENVLCLGGLLEFSLEFSIV